MRNANAREFAPRRARHDDQQLGAANLANQIAPPSRVVAQMAMSLDVRLVSKITSLYSPSGTRA